MWYYKLLCPSKNLIALLQIPKNTCMSGSWAFLRKAASPLFPSSGQRSNLKVSKGAQPTKYFQSQVFLIAHMVPSPFFQRSGLGVGANRQRPQRLAPPKHFFHKPNPLCSSVVYLKITYGKSLLLFLYMLSLPSISQNLSSLTGKVKSWFQYQYTRGGLLKTINSPSLPKLLSTVPVLASTMHAKVCFVYTANYSNNNAHLHACLSIHLA